MSSDPTRAVRTVFCATDFSPTAELALAHAEAIAKRHGARLLLGHVVEPWPAPMYPPVAVPDDTERILRAAAKQRLEALVAARAGSGLAVEARVVSGGPGRESVELAKSAAADLIVVGTHGRSGLPHLVYGSTAEYIVRSSPIPVLTVHPHDPGPDGRMGTIVVPTDLSAGAGRAVEELMRLFPASPPAASGGAKGGQRLVLVYVDEVARYFEPYGEGLIPVYADLEARQGDLRRALEEGAARLRKAGFEAESRIVAGKPVDVICDVAKREQASLIALGTHGHSPIVNLLMGRTAQRVVQHAPCPVLSVRSPDRPLTPP